MAGFYDSRAGMSRRRGGVQEFVAAAGEGKSRAGERTVRRAGRSWYYAPVSALTLQASSRSYPEETPLNMRTSDPVFVESCGAATEQRMPPQG